MSKFKVGDSVRVMPHVAEDYGRSGTVKTVVDHGKAYELDIGGPFHESELESDTPQLRHQSMASVNLVQELKKAALKVVETYDDPTSNMLEKFRAMETLRDAVSRCDIDEAASIIKGLLSCYDCESDIQAWEPHVCRAREFLKKSRAAIAESAK